MKKKTIAEPNYDAPPVTVADPTILTTQMLRHELRGIERELGQRQETREREQAILQKLFAQELAGIKDLADERFSTDLREAQMREAHRLELKADNQRTVETAMVAAEKAVQAALAAAEKARDQQTIASQLATTKAEQAASEQMKQQGETFGAAINGLNVTVSDMKTMVGELRAEKRGGMEQVTDHRASTGQIIAVATIAILLGGLIVAVINMLLG
jgi:hypothetical protein